MLTATERPPLSLAAWTWIDSTPDGLVSFMLIAPARANAPGLQPIASRAGLATPDLPLPSPGIRIVLAGPDALVLLPRMEGALRVGADEGWADFARRGGTIVLLMGQRYLTPAARRMDVEEYLKDSTLSRQLWLGKTTLGADYTDQQRQGEACVVCSRSEPPLNFSGHAYTATSGAPLGWAVVAHPDCISKESA
ncbi:hypothetical protein ACGF0D_10845 [Kitasatospora sp. NPDC048298]|uniref:hypothetical protein n=1 Tax=Kitasatospora sp. NPDC048298 TaxID=3364049 RepID=UPI0037241F03